MTNRDRIENLNQENDDQGRLGATGSREPVWRRLPDEPPLDHDAATRDTLERGWVAPIPVAPAPLPPARRRSGFWQTLLAAVLGAGLALAGFLILDDDPAAVDPADALVAGSEVVEPVADEPEPAGSLLGLANFDAAAIGDAVIPSIVTVQVGNGSGSGVIMSADGLIITNDHVVAAGSSYQVILSDGRTAYAARLVGTDPLTDLAVLEIDAEGLTPIQFGDTTTLRVGEGAIAVGSPLGLDGGPSLTVGVVSAFGRQVQVSADDILYGMLQTDAPITQGSSGGALVDAQGRLIGITTAVGVSDVGLEGIGFATPVELVQRVVDDLVADGSIDHAFLGIFGATSFADAADGSSIAVGVEVSSVEADTGAAEGGLLAGDLITAVNGEPVTTMDDLIVALRYQRAGDGITVTVSDDTGPRDLSITLGARP